jgi:hypothetical protein
MNFQAKPSYVTSAENELKEAIGHYILMPYNFPQEVEDCISKLKKAIDLLLNDYYYQYGQDPYLFSMENKINLCDWWDESEKNKIRWTRQKRNDVEHLGEAYWNSKDEITNLIKQIMKITGKLYRDLGFGMDRVFSPTEQSILKGEEPEWSGKVKTLETTAFQYMDKDTETAIQVINEAYMQTLRWYADKWRSEEALDYPFEDFREKKHEFFLGHFPKKLGHRERYKGLDFLDDIYPTWPLRPGEILGEDPDQSVVSERKIQDYIECLNWIIDQFILEAPELDYLDTIENNLSDIMIDFHNNHPEIEIPTLSYIETIWHTTPREINFWFTEYKEKIGWVDSIHNKTVKEIIESHCGPIPYNLKIEFNFPYDPKIKRSFPRPGFPSE